MAPSVLGERHKFSGLLRGGWPSGARGALEEGLTLCSIEKGRFCLFIPVAPQRNFWIEQGQNWQKAVLSLLFWGGGIERKRQGRVEGWRTVARRGV